VEGYPQEAATTAIQEADLTLGAVTQTFDDSVPSGNVISQDPAGGAEAVSGSVVDLMVSRGVASGVVPDIVGELRSAAEADITAAGLVVGTVTEQYSQTVGKDRVIRQTPTAGTELAKGSPVNFVVSLGKEQGETSTVPNVVNTPVTSARAAITAAGFVVGVEATKYDDTVPAGWVMAQSPAGGAQSAPGTPVDLVVSKGRAPSVTVPNVVGMTQAAAGAVIDEAGLTLGPVTEAFSATVPADQVIIQTPAAGESVAAGSAVSLVVSRGPDPGEGEGEPPLAPTAEEVLALLAVGFNAADTNGDGRISYAEVLVGIPGLTLAVFNELDTDGDGALDRAELGLDEEAGCFGCQKSGFTPIDLKKRLGDLFLAGLALSLLAVAGRRKV